MTTVAVSAPRRASLLRRILKALLVILAALYLAYAVFFYTQQDKMTFPVPVNYPNTTPLDAGIPFEDLHIPVKGSGQIHAWWIPSASPSERVILAFHGNGYVIEQAVIAGGDVVTLHQLGTNVLFIDYRGYGSSSHVPPSEKRIYEDADAAFTYLTAQRKVPSHNIIILGRSLGTAAATELASKHADAGGLILVSPFTSLIDAGKSIWYLRALPLTLLVKNPFDNYSRIGDVRIPVLITVGTKDDLTPPPMAQSLFDKGNQPKRLYLHPGAGHNDMFNVDIKELEEQMSAFIQSVH